MPRLLAALAVAVAVAVSGALLAPGPVAAAGEPVALEFQVQPGGGPAVEALPRQPVVRVVDAAGNTVPTSSVPVSLSMYPGGSGVPCHENPVRAVNGVATFQGCTFFSQGAGVRIRATAYGLDAAISEPFDVGQRAQNHTFLSWDWGNGGPFTATAEGPVWVDLRVLVLNTTAPGPAGTPPVTLSMAPNGEGATVSCTGGLTVDAVAGVARFTGCSISKSGLGFRLVASTEGVPPAWSYPIDVWPPGTPQGPNLEASGSGITWGSAVAIHVEMHPMAAGQAVAGRVVHVEITDNPYDPGSWRTIGDVTTDATGSATFSGYRPTWNRWYRAIFDGAADLGPAISHVTRIVVRQKITIRPAAVSYPQELPPGTTTFRAIVRPSRPDTHPGAVYWAVRGPNGGTTAKSVTDSNGVATLTITLTRGYWVIRARTLPTPVNANSVNTYNRYVVR